MRFVNNGPGFKITCGKIEILGLGNGLNFYGCQSRMQSKLLPNHTLGYFLKTSTGQELVIQHCLATLDADLREGVREVFMHNDLS